MTSYDAPAHLVPRGASAHHGVALVARQVAGQVRADVVDAPGPRDGEPLHLHVTDRLFGATPEVAAAEVATLCRRRPTTLTLHDVPQPGDGPDFARRATAYRDMVRHSRGWVVCSHHELALLRAHTLDDDSPRTHAVIPRPVVDPPRPPPAPAADPPVVAVVGWVYPGKGHREVIEAASALDQRAEVVALGAPAAGHDRLVEELAGLAERLGVAWRVTGALGDDELLAAVRTAAVGVSAHRNLSASGSVNTWIAAGRRPLVRRGRYAREMADLRPGTLTLVDDGQLVPALARALRDPGTTLLGPTARTQPHLPDTAAQYLAWWRR